ncbi:fido domain-containing protein [Rhizophagus diaphanus]|nr:fido domain-containing protein [Rhizophagus diaphanus] [Rhizophagus sp. MUCL 43196]
MIAETATTTNDASLVQGVAQDSAHLNNLQVSFAEREITDFNCSSRSQRENTSKMEVSEYQEKNIHYLKEIDFLRTKSPIVKILQNMIVNFSHRSCAIESNTLELSESQEIWDRLNKSYNLNNLLKNEKFSPPSTISSSDKSEKEIIEVRNHLLATYFIYNTTHKLNQEINIDGIKKVHRIMLEDTPMEKFCPYHNRKNMQQAGKFRTFVVQSYGEPFTVYPYDVEVSALMEEFMKFYDESKNIAIHPIMISCRLHASLAHIHPFYDGNGRVSRSIMAQYLICNGYLPAIFHQVKREKYINSLRKIQRGKDASLLVFHQNEQMAKLFSRLNF